MNETCKNCTLFEDQKRLLLKLGDMYDRYGEPEDHFNNQRVAMPNQQNHTSPHSNVIRFPGGAA